ncbi:MAG: hypothetical protein HZB62_08910 [Nitrospirae bacterium]|nr:hypothetical protein [Nitrospirota bacterium]
MSEQGKTKLLFAAIGVISGWLISGLVNILWFLYSVQVLGYGENAPSWYVSIRDVIRPLIIVVCMSAGYMVAQWNFRRALAKGRFREKSS